MAIMLLFAGCNERIVEIERGISFSGTSAAYSKALISSDEELQSEGFCVNAYISREGAYIPVLYNQRVTYSDGEWRYYPTSYWSKEENYIFSAYSPRLTDVVSTANPYVEFSLQTGRQIFHNIPQYQPINTPQECSSASDILTDRRTGRFELFADGKVKFRLSHELSQIEIRATKADIPSMQSASFRIVGLSIGDESSRMVRNTPRNLQKEIFTSVTEWSEPTYIDNGRYTLIASGDASPELEREPVTKTIYNMLVVPFKFGEGGGHKLPLLITYSKSEGGVESTYTVSGHAVTVDSFEAGKRYIVTIRLNTASVIEITEMVVEDWTPAESYSPPVYNW